MLNERAQQRRTSQWICPGPEWPPDDETCGKVLSHRGRCEECTRRRTLYRKEAARLRRMKSRRAGSREQRIA